MFARLIRDRFRERNAGAVNLDVDGENSSFLKGSPGVRLRKDYAFASGVFTAEITVRWDHDFVGDDYILNGRFPGQPLSVFTTRGERGDRDSVAPGSALNLRTKENVYFQLAYDGSFTGDSAQHRATLGLRYA